MPGGILTTTMIWNSIQPDSLTGEELDTYLAMGYYRMQQRIFTLEFTDDPITGEIRNAWWLRFPISGLREHASHRRMRRRNRSFHFRVIHDFLPTPEDEVLYARYLETVPFDGYPSIHEAMFSIGDGSPSNVFDTRAIALYDGERPVAMGIFDVGSRAGSSILHFYDPAYARYSPGKYLILLTVDYLKGLGCEWYYPGYVICGVPRFDYKLFLGRDTAAYFDPVDESWKPFDDQILVPDDSDW